MPWSHRPIRSASVVVRGLHTIKHELIIDAKSIKKRTIKFSLWNKFNANIAKLILEIDKKKEAIAVGDDKWASKKWMVNQRDGEPIGAIHFAHTDTNEDKFISKTTKWLHGIQNSSTSFISVIVVEYYQDRRELMFRDKYYSLIKLLGKGRKITHGTSTFKVVWF